MDFPWFAGADWVIVSKKAVGLGPPDSRGGCPHILNRNL